MQILKKTWLAGAVLLLALAVCGPAHAGAPVVFYSGPSGTPILALLDFSSAFSTAEINELQGLLLSSLSEPGSLLLGPADLPGLDGTALNSNLVPIYTQLAVAYIFMKFNKVGADIDVDVFLSTPLPLMPGGLTNKFVLGLQIPTDLVDALRNLDLGSFL
jgi:hypothetical protein